MGTDKFADPTIKLENSFIVKSDQENHFYENCGIYILIEPEESFMLVGCGCSTRSQRADQVAI
ncbi:hypothetical protein [Caldisericum exile]|uniref:Uncharacterized protein n=1 Tax=Caldisericum exile (strain DSM 21853 / NBRC 104410 / AZM16c01) TaxID=511051 RepID=A0A7U6GD53_CALEA|nr:hypothetical protein [Caldisericum exile]BAL80233.1 hypothetical protein CSE_01070 [Caldisericum exile AZM16c01]